ncbi:MAG TPA: DUF72 domain-containing protein [Candidatus Polarisedimenticolia bacterium]|nr:DUF72 domain-containing protein [Candidatus Polarisedimenticolia bacterium]
MVRVGIAGWDYRDWAGVVYPDPSPRRFDRLAFLCSFFDVIEINSTFYRQPAAKAARSWASRVSSESSFRFTAKLFQIFTHAPSGSLTLRDRAAGASGDLDLRGEARTYLAGIAPLLEARRLGAVLMQFPQAFHDRPESRAHLETVARLLPGLPLVAEFRHRSWDNAGALAFLRNLGVGFCNIDQPALGGTLPPTAHVTSRVAYVRLHGRNAANWFRETGRGPGPHPTASPVAARYDYLYSMEELRPWVERIRSIAAGAEEVFVIANNHYRGKGPANALMIKSSLSMGSVKAPAGLVAAYTDLKTMAEPVEAPRARSPRQGRLF